MAIQVQGNAGVVADVDGTNFRALRVTARPVDYGSLGKYQLSMTSGTLAAAIVANSELFQFRWTDATRLALVDYLGVSAGANVAATAAGLAKLAATIARSWSVDGTGGTPAVLTTHNNKLRSSGMGSSLAAARMATTAALGAGTKTLDAQDVGTVAFGIGTGAITTSHNLTLVPDTALFDAIKSNQHPAILAQNEGVIVRLGNVMPAAMTWHCAATIGWTEAAAY